MKLEEIVCSKDWSIKLRDLGVPQESFFYWAVLRFEREIGYEDKWRLKSHEAMCLHHHNPIEAISAFTSSELGEMLPQTITIKKVSYQLFISVGLDKQWFVVYANEKDYHDNAPLPLMLFHNQANSKAATLCHLLENKIITPEALNS